MAYQSFEMSYQPTDTPYFTVQPMTPPAATQATRVHETQVVPQPPSGAPSDRLKLKYSVITGILFLIISSPQVYQLTEFLLGRLFTIASPLGCPTVPGLLLHTVVFTAILYAMMKFPHLL